MTGIAFVVLFVSGFVVGGEIPTVASSVDSTCSLALRPLPTSGLRTQLGIVAWPPERGRNRAAWRTGCAWSDCRTGYGYVRDDGIAVIPIGALTAWASLDRTGRWVRRSGSRSSLREGDHAARPLRTLIGSKAPLRFRGTRVWREPQIQGDAVHFPGWEYPLKRTCPGQRLATVGSLTAVQATAGDPIRRVRRTVVPWAGGRR